VLLGRSFLAHSKGARSWRQTRQDCKNLGSGQRHNVAYLWQRKGMYRCSPATALKSPDGGPSEKYRVRHYYHSKPWEGTRTSAGKGSKREKSSLLPLGRYKDRLAPAKGGGMMGGRAVCFSRKSLFSRRKNRLPGEGRVECCPWKVRALVNSHLSLHL